MKHIDRLSEVSVPNIIGDATEAVLSTEMSAEDIQKSLQEAAQLIIALSKKRPSSSKIGVEDGSEVDTSEAESSEETVGHIRGHTNRSLRDRVSHRESRSAITSLVRSDALSIEDSSDHDGGQVHEVPERERGDNFWGEQQRTLDPFTDRAGDISVAKGFDPHELELPRERMQRLIDAAIALLNPDNLDEHASLFSREMLKVCDEARAAIDAIKYPGGASPNPFKLVTTLRNLARFVNGRHAREVEAAEEKFYPVLIKRAVERLRQRKTGTSWMNADISAAIEKEVKAMLPRTFQIGSGWRASLRRELRSVLSTTTALDEDVFS